MVGLSKKHNLCHPHCIYNNMKFDLLSVTLGSNQPSLGSAHDLNVLNICGVLFWNPSEFKSYGAETILWLVSYKETVTYS